MARKLAPELAIGYRGGMASEPYKPAGYCPHCGYAIDPGTCSECGKTSSASQLHPVPYWVVRKRIIKFTIISIVTLGILIGGWYFCFHVKWESRLPTSILLRLQGGWLRRLDGELCRRFNRGMLSPAEQQQMFANDLAETDLLQIRHACPAGVRVFINRPKMPDSLVLMNAYCQQLIVDGQAIDPTTKRMGDWLFSPVGWVIGPFAPGRHEVTQVLAITQFKGILDLNPSPGMVPFATFTTSRTLLVENKRVTEYAKPVWSPELAQAIKQKATALVCRPPEYGYSNLYVVLRLESAPVPVAGRVWCDFGDGRMPVLGGVAWRGREKVPGFFGGADYDQMTRPLPFPEDVPLPPLVDIYLVPDPEVAFNSDLTEYFDGVIVWSKCRVEKDIRVDSKGQVTNEYNKANEANRLGEVHLPATQPWPDQERMRERTAEVGLLQ